MFRLIKNLIFALCAVGIAVALYLAYAVPENRVEVEEGRIAGVKTMVQLCSIELYNEVPMLDTINNKVIFAIQKQQGSISFDLEDIKADLTADTVRIELPAEKVEIFESVQPGSWQVIDTKNLSILGSDRLTDYEEKIVKDKLQRNSVARLYKNGTVARARAEAVGNLTALMLRLTGKPVVVVDPTPRGAALSSD